MGRARLLSLGGGRGPHEGGLVHGVWNCFTLYVGKGSVACKGVLAGFQERFVGHLAVLAARAHCVQGD